MKTTAKLLSFLILLGFVLNGCATSPEHALEVLQYSANSWKQIISWDLEESVRFLSFTSDNKGIWLKSNVDKDRIGLVRLDLGTGRENLIYQHPGVDLEHVSISYLTKEPVFAASFPDYQKLHFYDKKVEALSESFRTRQPVNLSLTSSNNSETLFTVAAYTDKDGEHFLFNRYTRQKELFSRHPISVYHDALGGMEPISFQSRDGQALHGYLTRPTGTSGRMLPTVLIG
jgi:dipeptidyl aminopeptidase/acylaminoacyl peptidase